MRNSIFKAIIFLFLFLLITAPVLAFEKPDNSRSEGFRHFDNNSFAVKPTLAQKGLLRSCQARENAIKTRMNSLINLVDNMETKFSSISARVEDYYTSKVVPSGKSVSNYDTLVSDIQTKKDAVGTSISVAKTDVSNFNCNSTDPKADLTKFREDMQSVKKALKDYRTAIKKLIVAVRSVVGEENETSPTPTP